MNMLWFTHDVRYVKHQDALLSESALDDRCSLVSMVFPHPLVAAEHRVGQDMHAAESQSNNGMLRLKEHFVA